MAPPLAAVFPLKVLLVIVIDEPDKYIAPPIPPAVFAFTSALFIVTALLLCP
jgi:hypothetical protein